MYHATDSERISITVSAQHGLVKRSLKRNYKRKFGKNYKKKLRDRAECSLIYARLQNKNKK